MKRTVLFYVSLCTMTSLSISCAPDIEPIKPLVQQQPQQQDLTEDTNALPPADTSTPDSSTYNSTNPYSPSTVTTPNPVASYPTPAPTASNSGALGALGGIVGSYLGSGCKQNDPNTWDTPYGCSSSSNSGGWLGTIGSIISNFF